MKKIVVLFLILTNLSIISMAEKNVKPPVWTKKAPGVWSVTVGRPEKVDLLSELNVKPKLDALSEMGDCSLPIDQAEINFKLVDGKTYIRFPLEVGEKIFGLGLNFKSVEQRGKVLRMHVDHYGGKDDGRTHAPIPFFVSGKGYGALINSARYLDFWVGTGVRRDSRNPPVARDRNTDPQWNAQPNSDNLEVLVPAEGVEIIVFSGESTLDVVRRYNLFFGGGCLPPRWGLGFWQRVPTLYSDKDVEKEVQEFQKHDFPLSVIGLEPGWMSRAYPCTYEWDKTRFPDPKGFINTLKAQNIQTNVWINPYVSPDGVLYNKILPYTGSHTVWCGVVPDYTMPAAQKILVDHFKKFQVASGVSGFKMDENDGYDSWLWPDVAEFPSGIPAEQMRQIYGSLMQSVTSKMYRDENVRTYGLVRAANAGTSSFPYVLYNDYYNHRDFVTAMINSSFLGVLWTPEVRSSKTSEEWLRRMQTVCFSPLAMLNAWADGTKPWSFPDVAEAVNEVAKLRMQLIPYFYNAFAAYAFEGIPPIRAMNLEPGYQAEVSSENKAFDGTENPYSLAVKKEVKDQFMVGEYLLVAPLFEGEKERKVVLPQGKWFDFYTGQFAGAGEIITVSPGLDHIPVFVKDGGIIPMYTTLTKIDDQKHPLEIRYYGEKDGSASLYDDDGVTYDYEKGEYTRILLKVSTDSSGKKRSAVIVPENKKVWSYSDFTFRFMTEVKPPVTTYQANWESLSNYSCPEWFKDSKFGIFIHWGVYSVPAFGSEWYPSWMYKDTAAWGTNYFKHHVEKYGTQDKFGYKDFIPMFKAEKFNAAEWISLFKKSGAKYVIPVAEHHDGFAMYNSALTRWNSVNMGPKRDVIGELAKACQKQELIFGLSSHRIEHWWFMGNGTTFNSDVNDPEYADLYGPAKLFNPFDPTAKAPQMSAEFMNDWLLRCTELVNMYHPQLIWFDWWIEQPELEPYRKSFAAYYYNNAKLWNKEVVINFKHNAFPENVAVYDIERGSVQATKKYPWQTDTSVGKKAWGYIEGEENKTSGEIIDALIDIVSKNGNLLLNIGPKADGTISPEQTRVLLEIGEWLAINGEGIYGTRPWEIAGEGPTENEQAGKDFNEFQNKAFTAADIRFTTKGNILYAFCLDTPKDLLVPIKSLGLNASFSGKIKKIELLGSSEKLKWKQNGDALIIQMTKIPPATQAIAFKIWL